MIGTNAMVGLCAEERWNEVHGKRETIQDENRLSLGSMSQGPGRVKQGVLL